MVGSRVVEGPVRALKPFIREPRDPGTGREEMATRSATRTLRGQDVDERIQAWRKRAEGDVMVVRYADGFVVGFQHRHEAERFLAELRERFARFGLELHVGKTPA
jgi:hypothetical protein